MDIVAIGAFGISFFYGLFVYRALTSREQRTGKPYANAIAIVVIAFMSTMAALIVRSVGTMYERGSSLGQGGLFIAGIFGIVIAVPLFKWAFESVEKG